MNITELRYIIEIAQCGSVSAASKRLYVAQPNVSKAIRNLEEEYQIQLFVRTARGMVPTREGQQFIAQARRVIQEIEGLNRKFPGNKKGTDVDMKISIPRASYASYAFGKYVEQVRDAEELRLHIRECNSVQALDNLTKQHYNLALIRMEDKYEEYYYSIIHLRGLEYEKIMDFQYRLVVNENDPLATKKLNGYEDLEPYIELIHGDSRLPNGEYLDIKETPENQNAHRRIHVYERGNQFMLLKDIPGTYMWVSPIPEELLRRNGLAQRKIEWQQRRMKDVMVYPGRKFLSEDEREFIRQLKKEAIEVSK